MNRKPQLVSAIAIAILVVATFYLSFYILPQGWHPCDDYLATDEPQATFEFIPEQNGNALTIVHSGGDTINTTNSRSLTVRITDSETGTVARVVWMNETIGNPVTPGDKIPLHQDSLKNITFSKDDKVEVIWRGTTDDTPVVCPTHYDVESLILGQYVFDNSSGSSHRW